MKPLCIDLYCGLEGWGEAFALEGYHVVGFDIVDMCEEIGQPRPAGCELVLRDVRSLAGAELIREYGIPAIIVGSSPCQEFSYRAMPWKRAKALPPPYLGMELFQAQFRIQREACEAAGRHIPLVVENVRGAQKWVGRARWHFGSYYLWGDVPALMPMTRGARKVPIYSDPRRNGGKGSHMTSAAENLRGLHGANEAMHVPTRMRLSESEHGASVDERAMPDSQPVPKVSRGLSDSSGSQAGLKVPGFTWSDHGKPGYKPRGMNVTAAQRYREEFKQKGSGAEWFDNGLCTKSSKSDSRKAASALIAKIPFPLAQHIARAYKPEAIEATA
jgi:hypothetical protein